MSSTYSTSSTIREQPGPRYAYCMCKCGRKAALRIVESNKPSKGRLYFNCSTKFSQETSCDFFAWCHPIGPSEGSNGILGDQHVGGAENEIVTKETYIGREYPVKIDSHRKEMEAVNERMYIVMFASLLVSLLALLLNLFK